MLDLPPEADAPLAGRVGVGAVDQADVMERHFASLQFQHFRFALVDLYRDLLAARQEIAFG